MAQTTKQQRKKTPIRYRAAHGLWRRLPRGLRQGVLGSVMPALAPKKASSLPSSSLPITVAGHLTTPSGMGHTARIALDALDALSLGPTAVNLSHAFNISYPALPEPRFNPPDGQPGGTLLLHVNGPYVPYVLGVLGRRQVAGRRLIGCWHWELPLLPKTWLKGAEALHEVWVPTQFVADAVRPMLQGRVRVVPHPVPAPPPVAADRAHFKLADDAFVVLVAANVASGFFRKNVLGAIAAFRRAFGTDARARLLVKLGDLAAWPQARKLVQDAIGHAANIQLLEGTLSRLEFDRLLMSVDVVLSLHRSEGFGLVPAEAMRLGRPVVATAWSGNLDFMDEASAGLVSFRLVPAEDPQKLYNLPGQRWAEPDLDHAVEWLRRFRAEPALRAKVGAAAQLKAEACFGLPAFARALARALPDLAPRLAQTEAARAPAAPPVPSPDARPARPPASRAKGAA